MRLYDYAASPNCYKVRLLLAQLGEEYERVPVDIFGGDTLTDEYAQINPGRRVPVLETDDGEFLIESGAILLQRVAAEDVHGNLLVVDLELGQQQPDLVAVG
jgi:glutathione S-transferase